MKRRNMFLKPGFVFAVAAGLFATKALLGEPVEREPSAVSQPSIEYVRPGDLSKAPKADEVFIGCMPEAKLPEELKGIWITVDARKHGSVTIFSHLDSASHRQWETVVGKFKLADKQFEQSGNQPGVSGRFGFTEENELRFDLVIDTTQRYDGGAYFGRMERFSAEGMQDAKSAMTKSPVELAAEFLEKHSELKCWGPGIKKWGPRGVR